jgi:hypothetical protein
MAKVIAVTSVYINRAKKYNQYSEGLYQAGHCCQNCLRKHFSYPYTCNDGFPCGDLSWTDRGCYCINWTNDKNCKVD